MPTTSLLLLCGSSDGPIDGATVVWNPARAHRLSKETGRQFKLFGDFTPDDRTAARLDRELIALVDDALLAEHRQQPSLRWAPLAVQQLQFRLARYQWLKHCAAEMLEYYEPSSVVLSSRADNELTQALRVACARRQIELEVRDGDFDQIDSIVYLNAPYCIPSTLDPAWLWRLRVFFFGRTSVGYQPFWNSIGAFGPGGRNCSLNRLINVTGGLADKARFMLNGPVRGSVVLDAHVPIRTRYQLTADLWNRLDEDERDLASRCIDAFFNYYDPQFLDRIAERLDPFFTRRRIDRVVVVYDKLPSSRMLTFAAHRRSIEVDYLVHGVQPERTSAPRTNSPFLPDRYLTWNAASALRFSRLGYESIAVRHPRNDVTPAPYRPLSKNWVQTKALLLSSDAFGVSLASRQDCFLYDLIEMLTALARLGCRSDNVFVKPQRANAFATERLMRGFDDLRQQGFTFTLLDAHIDTATLMTSMDLLLTCLTSGMCEAALYGVPIVKFGTQHDLVGAYEGVAFPTAATRDELVHVLEHYDDDAVTTAYRQLTESLLAGDRLQDIYGRPIRRSSEFAQA